MTEGLIGTYAAGIALIIGSVFTLVGAIGLLKFSAVFHFMGRQWQKVPSFYLKQETLIAARTLCYRTQLARVANKKVY